MTAVCTRSSSVKRQQQVPRSPATNMAAIVTCDANDRGYVTLLWHQSLKELVGSQRNMSDHLSTRQLGIVPLQMIAKINSCIHLLCAQSSNTYRALYSMITRPWRTCSSARLETSASRMR